MGLMPSQKLSSSWMQCGLCHKDRGSLFSKVHVGLVLNLVSPTQEAACLALTGRQLTPASGDSVALGKLFSLWEPQPVVKQEGELGCVTILGGSCPWPVGAVE